MAHSSMLMQKVGIFMDREKKISLKDENNPVEI